MEGNDLKRYVCKFRLFYPKRCKERESWSIVRAVESRNSSRRLVNPASCERPAGRDEVGNGYPRVLGDLLW